MMNLPVIFSKVFSGIKGVTGNGLLLAKKHAPEIMIGAGILGFGGTIYETAKATNKTNDILARREDMQAVISMNLGDEECDYDEQDYIKDSKELAVQTRWNLVRTWAPVATLGTASVISVLGGYRILNGRYVATAAAYKVLENSFDRYRGNVIDRFGKDADWEMYHGIKAEEMERARQEQAENREIDADNKRKKLRKKKHKTAFSGIYNRIFDENTARWQRYWTPELALDFIMQKEREMNDLVMHRGFAFVNEAYDKLGFDWVPEGQVTGWLRPPFSGTKPMKKIVDFGLDDIPPDEMRKILAQQNCNIRIPISLNNDGLIYNEIGRDYILT